MNTTNSGLKYIMIGALVLFVALAIAAALTMPDRRSAGEKVGNA